MMAPQVRCAAILAGGHSSRMGEEKALLRLDGRPLIERVVGVLKPIFPEICVVTSKPEVARAAQCLAVSDRFENRGPLGGIHAALDHFRAPTFLVACDMPFLCAPFIEWLAQSYEGKTLIPRGESGFEPLHAIYSPTCTPIFQAILQGEGKMPSLRRVIESLDSDFVSVEIARGFDPILACFSNWNTPEDARIIPARPET